MTVREILENKGNQIISIGPEATVLEAADLMNQERIGSVVVFDSVKGVVGIFSERDVMRRVVVTRKAPDATRVKEVMSSPVTICHPETTLKECQAIMTTKRIRHLPVVDNGELVGMISTGDIMAKENDAQQTTIEYLHEYIHGRT